jgi:hypothetical protein
MRAAWIPRTSAGNVGTRAGEMRSPAERRDSATILHCSAQDWNPGLNFKKRHSPLRGHVNQSFKGSHRSEAREASYTPPTRARLYSVVSAQS